MVFWTLKWIIISVSLIFLMHHLFTFFKNTLTVPKIKDLVDQHDLYTTLLQQAVPSRAEVAQAAAAVATSQFTQETDARETDARETDARETDNRANDDVSMQTELQQFLKDLKKSH
jgi:hypothetical protein